ncbi:NUDIX domain-containing protein [Kitasatospora misakiensis]|uniref:NUDIX domain-containing protein n=1 Tax=Kitasatospora misakiensis TaxID=67330 RepID=A0ABW0X9L1_9ACTN
MPDAATPPPPPPPLSEVLGVRRIRLAEVAAPRLTVEERRARDQVWATMVLANPTLFDGPVVACSDTSWPRPGELHISWCRVPYRHYALRRVTSSTAPTASLSVSVVQPTDDGRLLVGRMAPTTAAPGRWQFAGGSVEPPPDGERLDLAALRRDAVRELAEETGVAATPQELELWAVTRGQYGSVGVLFLAPPLPEPTLREHFTALAPPERELVELAFVRSPTDLPGLPGPHADYLPPVLRRLARRQTGQPGQPGLPR